MNVPPSFHCRVPYSNLDDARDEVGLMFKEGCLWKSIFGIQPKAGIVNRVYRSLVTKVIYAGNNGHMDMVTKDGLARGHGARRKIA